MRQANDLKDGDPRIRPLPEERLPADLKEKVYRLEDLGILSSTVPARIWAHRPVQATNWLSLIESFYSESVLTERLRELIRLRIAAITNCEACKLARKSDTVSAEDVACIAAGDERFNRAEHAAMDFAARLAGDHDTITDKTFEQLRTYFSDEQIVEINMFAALMLAGGRMTHAQKAYSGS
ncbi:carboxymuconolactone decarboxylase family protein [Hyphomonas sp. CY54-11-8]|uniref:carboxymuconolactone decarboxylase family protein n=1 Tax=Hyphomonas sp. CY54-11-8 TaxID=1280944 RepID=UPI000458AA15|nr:carboxymuconolactone decarboxylase family protein [Hyphomonas sp. CY54-11-8]KCZ45763.1 hypothetical protein HY17_10525 [Hyphomonas sp. CY54-11-8]